MDKNSGERPQAPETIEGTRSAPPPRFVPPPTPAAAAPLAATATCQNCGQAVGPEPSCQTCGQVLFLPRGIPLATVGLRFGGYLLEGVLIVCTLVIGWFVWAFIVFQYGQTPAKQLLHMRVVFIPEARTAGWWRMFFREFIAKTIIAILASFTLLIPYFWLMWDRNRQELWDKMATTLVVSDPQDQLAPRT
ncbi:RDD family protein [Streptomyces griseus]|uniref:RDD family protein n=1 Tax=Streptomyces griseus TaxID=1911 RepID=UPI00099BF7A6|nr:RDD family protein [Streptomyces griseus]